MSETAQDHPRRDRDTVSWRDQLPAMTAVAVIAALVGGVSTFGGKMLQTSSTADLLTDKVGRIEKQNDTQEILLREIIKSQATAYTRDEARQDREAAERRFQSMELRIGEIGRQAGDTGRRVESLEEALKIHQFVIDKFISTVRR